MSTQSVMPHSQKVLRVLRCIHYEMLLGDWSVAEFLQIYILPNLE